MVLRLKTRESRSLPGLPRAVRVFQPCAQPHVRLLFTQRFGARFTARPDGGHTVPSSTDFVHRMTNWMTNAPERDEHARKGGWVERPAGSRDPWGRTIPGAGWSSPVARQAHNLKVAGSNPAPATKPSQPPPPNSLPIRTPDPRSRAGPRVPKSRRPGRTAPVPGDLVAHSPSTIPRSPACRRITVAPASLGPARPAFHRGRW